MRELHITKIGDFFYVNKKAIEYDEFFGIIVGYPLGLNVNLIHMEWSLSSNMTILGLSE